MVKDKVILISGGNSGIGAATAKLLALNGAKVVINYRENKLSGENLVKEICASTGKVDSARCFQADVSDNEEVKIMIKRIFDQYGKIDVIINNACPKIFSQNFSETKWSEFETFWEINIKGAYNIIQAVLPRMIKNKNGIIINVLSSYVFGVPPLKISPYITAKYALEGFSKTLAAELGENNIRVNMISPGITKTSFTEHLPEKMFELVAYQTPLKRISKVEDIAKVMLFLSSDNSKYLTGVNIPVSGGIVMS